MKRMFTMFAAAVIVTALFSSISFAAGFRLTDQDSAAMGMANAFVGQADNPSAVWFNPAGVTQLDGTRISGGVIGIYPVLTHENTNGATDVSKRQLHLPIHLYATHKLNEKIGIGFGITSPFGLASDWSVASSTRYVATLSKVTTIEFNPNIAYQLNDSLSVAFGIAYMHLQATLEKITPTSPLTDATFKLSGDANGWGANAALKYKASDTVNLGLSYRSRIREDVDGNAEITGTPLAGTAKTSITLPDLIQAGVSYAASDKLTLNADVDYTMWSTFDKLEIESNVPAFNKIEEHQWKNVGCLRIGGQYRLSDRWKLRAGYLYDQNPVPEEHFDTRTPDADRQGVSIGAGHANGNITVDVAYLYLRFNKRTINDSLADNDTNPLTPDDTLNGAYKSYVHIAGITIGYKF